MVEVKGWGSGEVMETALVDAGPAGRAGGLGQLGRGCTSARGPAFLPSLEGALGDRGLTLLACARAGPAGHFQPAAPAVLGVDPAAATPA